MSSTRDKILLKVRQADNLLGTIKGYLEEVGLVYADRDDDVADSLAVLVVAIDEIREAVKMLLEKL